MLFVFGKRAKNLRLNKLSELIHSSDAFKDEPLQYAKVSMYFNDIIDTGDGDEDYVVVEGSDMNISHVARGDNSSQYQINGKNATFKKVADTAQMEVNLLEDTVSRALDQLESAESELSMLDGKQASKRKELKDCEVELAESKERVGEAEAEL